MAASDCSACIRPGGEGLAVRAACCWSDVCQVCAADVDASGVGACLPSPADCAGGPAGAAVCADAALLFKASA